MALTNDTISAGRPLPLGATPTAKGTQFSVFSRHATAVSILLFETPQDSSPALEVPLNPKLNKTGDIWHAELPDVKTGSLYLFRVDGPFSPEEGHRFNPVLPLLDPYAKALTGDFTWDLSQRRAAEHGAARRAAGLTDITEGSTPHLTSGRSQPSLASAGLGGFPKCIVVCDDFDWRGDRPLNRPMRFSVVYETHVRSLTLNPNSGAEHPGTFRGVIEKIPYIRELGITAVELLPVQEFDELEVDRVNPRTGEPLVNYWGYSTIAFFAPKGRYSSSGARGEQVSEFKEMVRELHRAGIEVILDIVFNHTAEGNETGPTLNFRGLDNSIYYILDGQKSGYRNFSGCGNTMNCNHPIVRTLIMDCLRYWAVEMHVDGFRFDLGSVLGRSADGALMENPPILERIAEDPVLRNTKIIAEAWDAAGAYQVGSFPGGRWSEWNDRYRDDVRRFWRGDPGSVAALATRMAGSSDLYLRDGRKPFHSVNFVASHDGFTLNDLVTYRQKHNEDNGEDNTDGWDNNVSENYGVEGDTENPAIEAVRNKQVKNFLLTLLLSLGTPMILGGDEMRRTQKGNNNPYCQNNEISWYDWDLLRRHADIHRFCRELVAFRKRHLAFLRPEFFNGEGRMNRMPDVAWYTEDLEPADWKPARLTLAFMIDGNKADIEADRDDNDFFVMLNSSAQDVLFTLAPIPPGKEGWHRAIDTALPPPHDIEAAGGEERMRKNIYEVKSRSAVVFLSK